MSTKGQLQQQEFILMGLEARHLTPSCWQGRAPSEGCREHPSLPLLASGGCWQPLAFLGLWQHHSSAFIPMWPSSLCLYVSKLSYYMGPSHWKAGSLQISMTSSWLHRQRPRFQTQAIHRLGLEHNFGGTQSNPARCPQQAAVTVSSHYAAL